MIAAVTITSAGSINYWGKKRNPSLCRVPAVALGTVSQQHWGGYVAPSRGHARSERWLQQDCRPPRLSVALPSWDAQCQASVCSVTVPRCLRSYWEMLCAVPKQRPAGLSWSPGGRSIPVLLAASLKPSAALQPAGTRRACSSTSAGPPQAGSMPQQQPPCGGAGSGGCRAQSGVCPGAVSPLPGRGRVALTFQFTLRYRRAAQVCGEGRQTHGNTLAEIKPHWHPERSSTIYSL